MKQPALLFIAFVLLNPFIARLRSNDQSLEGQLTALASEIRLLQKSDRAVDGRKLRLDKISSVGMPDANYDQHIESGMEARLKDILDDESKLLLKFEIGYFESTTETNHGKRVVQITAKIIEGRTGKEIATKEKEGVLVPLTREVNNSADIAKLIGVTLSPPDTPKHDERLQANNNAFETPTFATLDKTRVTAKGNPRYAVELRKHIGGKGPAVAVTPKDQRGLAFAPIDIGDTYEIVLYNYDEGADAVAKVDIDGLDAINTFNKDVDASGMPISYPGYLIPRAVKGVPGQHAIPGWMHSVKPSKENDNVFQFVVNELGKGAAGAKKVVGKTGVVTVSFFDAYQPGEKPRGRSFGETGTGKPMKVDYAVKPVQIGSEPLSIVSVRYSRKPE